MGMLPVQRESSRSVSTAVGGHNASVPHSLASCVPICRIAPVHDPGVEVFRVCGKAKSFGMAGPFAAAEMRLAAPAQARAPSDERITQLEH